MLPAISASVNPDSAPTTAVWRRVWFSLSKLLTVDQLADMFLRYGFVESIFLIKGAPSCPPSALAGGSLLHTTLARFQIQPHS